MSRFSHLLSRSVLLLLMAFSPGQAAEPAAPSMENSLHMKFISVPATPVLMSIWDVRVRDFQAFVFATGYAATEGMGSLSRSGWTISGGSWEDPGFLQTADCPVAGVSWEDAHAFCAWLTEVERKRGTILPNQTYRLPTDAEWSAAVGPGTYPWGEAWPPPPGAGNYAGKEAHDETWPVQDSVIAGYQDGFPRTSPVGSFLPNQLGFYDLGGNLWQWCEDAYDDVAATLGTGTLQHDPRMRVLRGAAWCVRTPAHMESRYRAFSSQADRRAWAGFRVVLTAGEGK